MRVVTNASPLIVLCKGGFADLFLQVCIEVLVPDAVWQEVALGGKDDLAAQTLLTVNWAKRTEVTADDPVIRAWNLGAGETSVLNLALSLPGYRAVIDDGAARLRQDFGNSFYRSRRDFGVGQTARLDLVV